jgi:hypothetical protein
MADWDLSGTTTEPGRPITTGLRDPVPTAKPGEVIASEKGTTAVQPKPSIGRTVDTVGTAPVVVGLSPVVVVG